MSTIQLKKIFNFFCILELFSCALLFLVAMPLKYGFQNEQIMYPVGLFHGLAFIGYLIMAVVVRNLYNWTTKEFLLVLLFGFIPFATWFTHKKIENR